MVFEKTPRISLSCKLAPDNIPVLIYVSENGLSFPRTDKTVHFNA